jgi:cupin fold WbuC family metalloprotein
MPSMKIVTAEAIAALVARAAEVPRKRMNLNLHAAPEDPINRFLNAGLAGTYVRPHRHRRDKWELLSLLQGRIDVLIFGPHGEVRDRTVLFSGGASVMEISGGEWHSLVFGAPAAVLLEVKPGPYEPDLDKEFAAWAPAEGSIEAASFTTWLETAAPGDVQPSGST